MTAGLPEATTPTIIPRRSNRADIPPVMCQPFTLAEKELLGGTTIYQVVEVFAEAVQAEPADAAQEVWGVTVENGIITTAR